MKSRVRKRDRPEKGSLRVQSWIYAVLNPLVDGVKREKGFLEAGNLTWRFHIQNFEFLLPCAGYVGPGAVHSFQDFLKANPGARRVVDHHDKLLGELRTQAKRAYETLCANSLFLARVREKRGQFESVPTSRAYPGGAIPRDHFPRLVAERILNRVSNLPDHYTDAAFWRETGVFFTTFRNDAAFRDLESATASLRAYDGTLIDHLSKVRYRLCEEYDLPADPLPFMSHVAERPSYF